MPRKRRQDEDCGLVADRLLAEMQEVAEGMGGDDLLGDGDLAAVDRYRANAEIRPVIRHPGIGEQLHRGCSASDKWRILDQRPRLGQHTAEKFGHEAYRGENVAVYLIGVVKHISSSVRAPEFANFQMGEAVPASIDLKAKSSQLKTSCITRVYLY